MVFFRFLLAALQIEAVLDQTTVRDRRETAKFTTHDLYGAYQNTLDRINEYPSSSKSKQAMATLKWVFFAKEPLSVAALRHALGVRPNDKTLDLEGLPSEKLILDCCLGLVNLYTDSFGEVVFRLVHKSLQDYFTFQHQQGLLFQGGHNEIVATCLAYTNLEHVKEQTDVLLQRQHSILGKIISAEGGPGTHVELPDFLMYTYKNWGLHARECSEPTTEIWWNDVSDIVHRDNCVAYGLHPWMTFVSRASVGPWAGTTCHSLQLFAYFGIVSDFIRDQIRSLSYDDINIQSPFNAAMGWKMTVTALFLAAENGHEKFLSLCYSKIQILIST